jgi:hypothetical protein
VDSSLVGYDGDRNVRERTAKWIRNSAPLTTENSS